MSKKKTTPCHTCGYLKLSCCQDGGAIAWTAEELYKLSKHYDEKQLTKDFSIFRDNQLPGIYHILSNQNIALAQTGKVIDVFSDEEAFCTFYNKETFKCNVYKVRPSMCREFGKSLVCPYEDVKPTELLKAHSKNRQNCITEHKQAGVPSVGSSKYTDDLKDYIIEFVKPHNDKKYRIWEKFPVLKTDRTNQK